MSCARKGDNSNLRFILYALGSTFDNDTIENYKKNLPITIFEDDEPSASKGSGNPPPPKRRKPGGGMGLMGGSTGVASNVRTLGGGWFMDFDTVTSVVPPQNAAADLGTFYDGVITTAVDQLTNGTNGTEDVAFGLGGYNLRLSSPEPISWNWIINFAADMASSVSEDIAVLFKGEAYSYYWDIAAVVAILSTI